ncbi:hypothetical protein [Dyella mobilis]|uniref:hypothetical protein n=1 Tax=Dyella mobilis TaxID=1849582 RepID=UPI0024E168AD|nr:hypothetical protein [Dyella mobilis]
MHHLTHIAHERTQRVVEAIKRAMGVIQNEIKGNEGIYPQNRGRLTMAEVCRRADVHPITMMGKSHRDTTRPMVLDWLRKLEKVEGAATVQSTVTKRADVAKDEFRRIAAQFQAMYQVEMPARDGEIKRLNDKVGELQAENARLLKLTTGAQVVSLSNRNPRKK